MVPPKGLYVNVADDLDLDLCSDTPEALVPETLEEVLYNIDCLEVDDDGSVEETVHQDVNVEGDDDDIVLDQCNKLPEVLVPNPVEEVFSHADDKKDDIVVDLCGGTPEVLVPDREKGILHHGDSVENDLFLDLVIIRFQEAIVSKKRKAESMECRSPKRTKVEILIPKINMMDTGLVKDMNVFN